MKANSDIDPQLHLPQCFSLPAWILQRPVASVTPEAQGAFLDSISQETAQVVGIEPASVHYSSDGPLVSFGEGRARWWFRGDAETGVFSRVSPPREHLQWWVSPPISRPLK